MRARWLIAMLALLATLLLLGCFQPSLTDAPELEIRMAELINVEREARAVPRLTFSPELSEAAREYSREMASSGAVRHDLGGSVEERIRRGIADSCMFGENVAKHTSVDYSIGDFMLSPGHRANLLNQKFTHLGVGIVRADDGFLYITQEFTRRCDPAEKTRR
ncbi:MAG TPA: CAP domain-containing protein [Vicinamibacteria bacterium]|nr:CAP domain-containing protein [Vicinamibacteria bacterium]